MIDRSDEQINPDLDLGGGLALAECEEVPAVEAQVIDIGPRLRTDISYSEFTEIAINLGPHEQFNFSGREYLPIIYDSDEQEILLVSGRQTEKSTTHGNWLLCSALFHPGIRVLYVSPSDPQTKMFSFERVRSVLLHSPRLAPYFNARNLSVYNLPLLNGSLILMRSCYHSADRVRGIRADRIIMDEYQDILLENIPVIRECAFASPSHLRRFRSSGTPKTFDNPIHRLYERHSTMTELAFPCRAHGTPKAPWTWHWNIIREQNLGKTGLICARCGGPLRQDDPDATWVDTAPKAKERKVRGYHIGQPITPMAHRTPQDWQDLLTKRERYPRSKFMNEVLGESYDFGSKPLTETDLVNAQVRGWLMTPEQLERMIRESTTNSVFAGIDWGGAPSTKHTPVVSYTVIVLGTYAPSLTDTRFFPFYWHRFAGKEEDKELQLIKIFDLLRAYNVKFTIGDYGMGLYQNDWLVRHLGMQRYTRMQYLGKQPRKIIWRSKLGWFTAYKSALYTDVVNALKKGKIALPDWRVFAEPYGQDILNLLTEYNERRDEMQYIHHDDCTVDSFDALVYCLCASLREFPRPDITSLTIDTELEHEIVLEDPDAYRG